MDTLDLVLHPVRLRIIHAMSGGRVRTTSELCAALPDISKATMYRHVAILVDGGLLEVVEETRVHGAVERNYRLHLARTAITPDEAAAMTLDEHRRAFASAIAAMLAEFYAYLDRDGAAPFKDSVSYRQFPLWLSRTEVAELIRAMRGTMGRATQNRPSRGRSLYLFSPIFFPIEGEER